MAIITTNGSFGATSAVTSTTLNAVADAATFVSGAVDGTSLELISGGSDDGKLGIKDAGVTTAKVADSSSKTTGVTFAKMQHISTAKVLGRTSASEGDVEEVDLLDQDDMSSNSATSVATQQSIKAYADAAPKAQMKVNNVSGATYNGEESVTLPNGLIMKFGLFSGVTTTGTTLSFGSAFPTAVISATATGNTTNTITISSNYAGKCAVSNVTTSGMKIWGEPGSSAYWTAIGH
jgi:hypothetical protein